MTPTVALTDGSQRCKHSHHHADNGGSAYSSCDRVERAEARVGSAWKTKSNTLMKRVKLSLMVSPSYRFLIKLFTFRRVRGESSKEMIEKIESSGSIRATFSSTLHDCSLDGEVRCSGGETNEMLLMAGSASRHGNCQQSRGRW